MDKIKNLIEINNYGEIKENISFKKLTSIKIGGICKFLYFPNTYKNLIVVLKYIKEKKISYFIIGNGTNLLINDNYYEGIVISLKKISGYEIINDNVAIIEAGSTTSKIVKELIKDGYGGLEYMMLIPGTIGGMIYNNSECYNHCISDNLYGIDIIDENNEIRFISKSKLNFEYRNSNIKKSNIIVRGYFKLGRVTEIKRIKECIKHKRCTQPLNELNLGSTFKNTTEYKAWEIIDKLGFRGYAINDACVSIKHANFLINKKHANFVDMISLIELIQKTAYNKLNINLILEWEVIRAFVDTKK